MKLSAFSATRILKAAVSEVISVALKLELVQSCAYGLAIRLQPWVFIL